MSAEEEAVASKGLAAPMEMAPAASLSELLIEVGILDREKVEEVLRRCGSDQRGLCDELVRTGAITEEKFLKTVSFHLGLPYFTNFEGILELEAVRLIPEELARKYKVLPLIRGEEAVTVGMVDPLDREALEALQQALGRPVLPVLTSLGNFQETFERVYGAVKPVVDLPVEQLPTTPGPVVDAQSDQTAIETVEMILQEGFARKASDIHLESAKDKVRVRYRIDGILQDAHVFNKEAEATLVARIKILSRLDITETRIPQDGRFQHSCGGGSLDIRVSTLPTIHGEKVTMRLLQTDRLKSLDELGIRPESLTLFRTGIHQPNGLILVTGPTGSGKTSTLYSVLQELNTSERNIVTLEDPVEYRLERLVQVEANAKTGLTFAVGLRAILRQDPNVILVGEIRDVETAEIAVQAAITGHMVFSTLHTNDAVSTIHRLINMKVDPFLLAAALRMVVAQRLLRRLCERCRTLAAPTPEEATLLGGALRAPEYCVPVGCEHCFNSGYAGRMPVFEVFSLGAAIRDCIIRGATLDEIRATAASAGLHTLQEEALRAAEEGHTSLAEVIRVTRTEG